jgi:hypothetical protein
LKKLKDAGINCEQYDLSEVQGKEFEYVIIDIEWKPLKNDYINIKTFLTDLYTAMTRAKKASVFIDRGLSKIIGTNVLNNNKSLAPSILKGVKELQEQKLKLLENFKLDLSEKESTPETKTEDKKKENKLIDFNDPDKIDTDKEIVEIIHDNYKEEKTISSESVTNFINGDSNFLLESYTDVTSLSTIQEEPSNHLVEYPTKKVLLKNVSKWKIIHPKEGPLRNAQALYNDGEEIIKYEDKQILQRKLFDIKSAIIFKHEYDDLPQDIKRIIKKSDWDNKELELEIREVDESDTTHINAFFDKPGFELEDKRYIIGIVLKTKNASGRDIKFDISGLPSLETFAENLPLI